MPKQEFGLLDYMGPVVVAFIFGIILLISTIQWFVDGRKNFTGPRAELSMEVLEAMKTNEPSAASIDNDPKLTNEIGK